MNNESLVIALVVVLLFIAAFLAMAETSLSRIDRYRARALAGEGKRGSGALLGLVDSAERFAGYLNSVLLLLLATQITAASAVAYLAFRWFDTAGFILTVIGEVVIGYVLTEAMPKTWAVQHTERSALWCAPIIAGISRVFPMGTISRPLIWTTNTLLPGKGLSQGPFIYEQQILALADTAAHEQAIERHEHQLIHSVIEFASTIAREVMVPRTDMVSVPAATTASAAIDLAIANGYSRIPVYGKESDEILGTLFTKDLLRAVHDGNEGVLISTLLRPVKFIPETKRVADLMREMQKEKVHMTIVVDEYGTVVGLVTLEDLIEELVGDITDEYDIEEQPQVEQLSDHEWRIDARMHIDEVYEQLNIRLPHGDWDTVGGLLINAFGRVPKSGESTIVDEYMIVADQTSGRRVTRARVKLLPLESETSGSQVEAS